MLSQLIHFLNGTKPAPKHALSTFPTTIKFKPYTDKVTSRYYPTRHILKRETGIPPSEQEGLQSIEAARDKIIEIDLVSMKFLQPKNYNKF